jgi:amino acid transporter
MNFSQITSYLFSVYPGNPDKVFWVIMSGLTVAFIVLGGLAIWLRKANDGYRRKLGSKVLTWSIISLIVTVLLGSFRYQNIYALSMRAFLISWLIIVIVWFVFIAIWWLRHVPAARQRRQERQEFDKYLPRRK